jgi:hypothetical protein
MECSVFILKDRGIVIRSSEDGSGNIVWQSPVTVLKGKPSAEDLGNAILDILGNRISENITSAEILKNSGFKTWDAFVPKSRLVGVSLKGEKVTATPYFTSADGEYYMVLNRDRIVDANAFETGNSVLKCLEYCE